MKRSARRNDRLMTGCAISALALSVALFGSQPSFAGVYVEPGEEDLTPAAESGDAEVSEENPVLREIRKSGLKVIDEAFVTDEGCVSRPSPEGGRVMPRRRADNEGAFGMRGEMAMDDGVLETLREDPCVEVISRDGSAKRYEDASMKDGDILRVNALEERRHPLQAASALEGTQDKEREPSSSTGEDSRPWPSNPSPRPPLDAPDGAWKLAKGDRLSRALAKWSEMAGWDLVWESRHDFVVRANAMIPGTFEEAIEEVLASFAAAKPALKGELYTKNKVLVVREDGYFDGSE